VLRLLVAVSCAALSACASFGGFPEGARLAQMQASPRWAEGGFQNLEETHLRAPDVPIPWGEFFSSAALRRPSCPLPLFTDTSRVLAAPPTSGLRLTWLGHSTVLVELDGARILTDPMFSDRASPSQAVGPLRFHPPPLPLEALPHLDAVVISHDHYDHLDLASVQALARTGVPFVVGLGVGAHLEAWGVPRAQIVELTWGKEHVLPSGHRLVSVPAQHFSGRRAVFNDRTLWTSWALVGPEHRVFFSGDTGLHRQFSTIAARYGPFDVAMLEIGQYHPAWGQIHLGPDGALAAHAALRARFLLPIHWATFMLGFHAWNEPPQTLLAHAGPEVAVLTPMLGEPLEPREGYTGTPWWRALPPIAAQCP
jgi:L-ascorbate metabolism protein UlaG (beta-lactamase superfamily)